MTLPLKVLCNMSMPNQEGLADHITGNRKYCSGPKQMVQPNTNKGQTVNICGAGPSLADYHEELQRWPAHQTWGCNSALPYLKDHGLPATHGFAVDQGVEMLNSAEWERTFDVTYLIATSVHPTLPVHLLKQHRRIKWFHNYLGINDPEGWTWPLGVPKPQIMPTYEWYLYCTVWPSCAMTGYGLNSVPRAIGLAVWMGFKTIRVFGADCSAKPVDATTRAEMPTPHGDAYTPWLDTVQLYASGRTPREAYGDKAMMVEAILCDDKSCDCRLGHPETARVRFWHTRPDMVISALHLMHIAQQFQGRVELIGDTLPNLMQGKPASFFEAMPQLTGKGSISGFSLVTSPPS